MALDTRVGCVGCSPEWRLTSANHSHSPKAVVPMGSFTSRESEALLCSGAPPSVIPSDLVHAHQQSKSKKPWYKNSLHSRTNENNRDQESRTDKFWALSDQIDKTVQMRVRTKALTLPPVHGSCRYLGEKKRELSVCVVGLLSWYVLDHKAGKVFLIR